MYYLQNSNSKISKTLLCSKNGKNTQMSVFISKSRLKQDLVYSKHSKMLLQSNYSSNNHDLDVTQDFKKARCGFIYQYHKFAVIA